MTFYVDKSEQVSQYTDIAIVDRFNIDALADGTIEERNMAGSHYKGINFTMRFLEQITAQNQRRVSWIAGTHKSFRLSHSNRVAVCRSAFDYSTRLQFG
jgi:hypothetical protein